MQLTTFSESPWWQSAPHRGRTTLLPADGAFAEFLERRRLSLLFTSRHSSILGAVSAHGGQCVMRATHVTSPMGLALVGSALAVGANAGVEVLRSIGDGERGEASFLPVTTHRTGPVSVHDVAWTGGGIAFVNTLFSAICVTSDDSNFEVLWTPDFITEPGPFDCCHLNGMAMQRGLPRYATALAESSEKEGWRKTAPDGGVLMDVNEGIVARNLSLPHSPRIVGEAVWLLETGRGLLLSIDARTGTRDVVHDAGGLCRGLDLHDDMAVLGISSVRGSSQSAGTLVSRFGGDTRCKLLLVDTTSGARIGELLLPAIDEISSLLLVPYRSAAFLDGDAGEAQTTFVCRRRA